MTQSNFGVWVVSQRHDASPVGRLARRCMDDGLLSWYSPDQLRREMSLAGVAPDDRMWAWLEEAIARWEGIA